MKVEYIDHSGDDLRVVNAARVSFDKESYWEFGTDGANDWAQYLSEKDEKLISYLAKHNHFTPFTHCTITLRETVPIFVARQRFKHVVGFTYNEVSRRYVDSPPEFYIPNVWRGRAENKKQGSSDQEVYLTGDIGDYYNACLDVYSNLLDEGVAPEQARMILPQSMYTSYYVSGTLAAFARAYNLRSQPDAQREIQELSLEWDKIIRPLYSVSWSSLVDP